jgi:hypothetical protein
MCPSDFPQSFLKAPRELNTGLNSANPQGALAYDELGGRLIGYDVAKPANWYTH